MHTPGPLTFTPQIGDEEACFRALVFGADGNVIATMEITNDERVATDYARLFAAAPEVRDLLLEFCDSLGDDDCIPTNRQMLVKKAAVLLLEKSTGTDAAQKTKGGEPNVSN